MEKIPSLIRKDIITYSLPLFLMNLSRNEFENNKYWLAIPGCVVAFVPLKSKSKLIVSSLLYTVQIFIPSVYFLCLGFILHQAYNSNLFISKKQVVCDFIAKIEIIGFLCSELVVIPSIIKLMLASLVIYISITCKPPCIESLEPFESMKARIESSSILNTEYRYFMDKTRSYKFFEDARLFYTEILYMISSFKIALLFFSFFSFENFKFLVFVIGILYIFGYKWEYLCIILESKATSNVLVRVIGSYIVYEMAIITRDMTRNE
jgi:hypothetical protein